MGYVNVYEFGGIEDWTGEIVMDEAGDDSGGEKAKLRFESFDGGGPEFNVAQSHFLCDLLQGLHGEGDVIA